jgi:SAM-dependent methyltransferase
MCIGAPRGRLRLRDAAARRSATWPLGPVGLGAASHTRSMSCAIAPMRLFSYYSAMESIPASQNLLSWLREHDQHVEWQLFAAPWDHMQREHNPFRDEQIEAILSGAGIAGDEIHAILDLGCGPGILGRQILSRRPTIEYYGADGDPLLLAAMQHLLPSSHVHPLLVDLRSHGWLLRYQNTFDAVVSLTALHWLTTQQLEQLYKAMHHVLKPGGRLVIGDPYLPESPSDRKKLLDLQEQYRSVETGMTWDEFWDAFYDTYPIREMKAAYQDSRFCGTLFQGSDDGYPISFYLKSLEKTGYMDSSIYWKKGLRVVYGGTKPNALD